MTTVIRLDYFTDPYCAWSWAFQATFTAIREMEGEGLALHYRQFPLIPDLAASGKSAQDVAQAWEHIARLTGLGIDPTAWLTDPPASTCPACRASKAAGLQGVEAEGRFIDALRPLLLTHGRVADTETLLEAARTANLDVVAFQRALASKAVEEALRADEKEAMWQGVESTPAVLLRNAVGDKILLQGPRDQALFERAIRVLRVEEEAQRLADEDVQIARRHEAGQRGHSSPGGMGE